jgi:hypothetical protein
LFSFGSLLNFAFCFSLVLIHLSHTSVIIYRLFWTWQWTYVSRKIQRISCLDRQLSAIQ